MSLRWFIYFCTMIGGCAAFLGWALGRLPLVEQPILLAAYQGLSLGLILAIGLTLVDLTWNLAGYGVFEAVGRLLIAAMVGAGGGFLGAMAGQFLYSLTQLSLFLILGWTTTGLLIGIAPGSYDYLGRIVFSLDANSAQRKVIQGMIGGCLGGLAGSFVFLWLRDTWDKALAGRSAEFWSPSATGFVALGMCIGLFIGLARVILKEAWIKVELGFRPGRELILSRPITYIGRAEGCDVGLFGDDQIEKQHAKIVQHQGRYWVEDLDSAAGVYVNGEKVEGEMSLRAGDLIEVGRAALRFGERVTQAK
jgi:hypothetical protein